MTAGETIRQLGLQPHPEGGWFRQTWAGEERPRASATCIYFLLARGERSHWHRVDATEIWHFYAGAPFVLRLSGDAKGPAVRYRLGPDLAAGEVPQAIVPPQHWQSAESTDDWSLAGCTVSPGFLFDGFDLAAPGFDIPDG